MSPSRTAPRSSRASTWRSTWARSHAVMGPNGSGKSTLAYALMGHPPTRSPRARSSSTGRTWSSSEADERAQRGLFLAFQYPHAVPGVTVTNFLRSAINAIRKARAGQDDPIPIPEFRKELLARMEDAEGHARAGAALHQRRLLRWRAQEDGDAAARDAEAAAGGARRDRHRARHRCAQGRRQRRQRARRPRDGRARDHPLPARPRLHQAQLRPRLRRRQDRRRGRAGARPDARGRGLQGVHPGAGRRPA